MSILAVLPSAGLAGLSLLAAGVGEPSDTVAAARDCTIAPAQTQHHAVPSAGPGAEARGRLSRGPTDSTVRRCAMGLASVPDSGASSVVRRSGEFAVASAPPPRPAFSPADGPNEEPGFGRRWRNGAIGTGLGVLVGFAFADDFGEMVLTGSIVGSVGNVVGLTAPDDRVSFGRGLVGGTFGYLGGFGLTAALGGFSSFSSLVVGSALSGLVGAALLSATDDVSDR